MKKSNEAIWNLCSRELKRFGIDIRCGGGAFLQDCLMVMVREELPEEETTVSGLYRVLDYDASYYLFCNSMRRELASAYEGRDEGLWLAHGMGIKPTVIRFLGKLASRILAELEDSL